MARRIFAVAASILIVGCPGKLENPERFQEGGTGACNLDVITDIIRTNDPGGCTSSICHDAVDADGGLPAGGLDLLTADLPSALVGKPASCEDPEKAECPSSCAGKLIIDPQNPEQSYLLEKVKQKTPTCGDPMPLGVGLSAQKIACLEEWVKNAAGDGGGVGGAGGSGGSGGASGSAGSGGASGSAGSSGASGAAGAGDGG